LQASKATRAAQADGRLALGEVSGNDPEEV